MENNYKLMPYTSKDIKVLRASVNQRSEGDGEENASSCQVGVYKDSSKSHPEKLKVEYEDLKFSSVNISRALVGNPHIPEISNIAQKLNKVSLFTAPDPLLLSAPPSDFEKMTKILLKPVEGYLPERKFSSSSSKRKEPKFVPYEPYKGCVKPILASKVNKNKKSNLTHGFQAQLNVNEDFGSSSHTSGRHSINESDRFNLVITDFEKEKSKWEQENNVLKAKNNDLQKQLSQSEKELSQLQQQLSIQSQVNHELKKLLVASVGEDVQGRVQCLTEDKARMATMIRKYSEKVDKDYEEKERISIQCDVWRSKFLASSLLIDELARWKGVLFQHYQDGQDALKVLLQEREVIHHSLISCYKRIHQIQEAFDPLHAESEWVGLLDASDVLSLSYALSNMAESLRDRLLGNLGRAVGNFDLRLPDETRTPGEKMAMQVLDAQLTINCASFLSSSRSTLITRFHPNSRSENLTVNCCGHCSGEIKVI